MLIYPQVHNITQLSSGQLCLDPTDLNNFTPTYTWKIVSQEGATIVFLKGARFDFRGIHLSHIRSHTVACRVHLEGLRITAEGGGPQNTELVSLMTATLNVIHCEFFNAARAFLVGDDVVTNFTSSIFRNIGWNSTMYPISLLS
jgi:hypothetical protein